MNKVFIIFIAVVSAFILFLLGASLQTENNDNKAASTVRNFAAFCENIHEEIAANVAVYNSLKKVQTICRLDNAASIEDNCKAETSLLHRVICENLEERKKCPAFPEMLPKIEKRLSSLAPLYQSVCQSANDHNN